MHRLLPGALEHVPLPERPAELARLRALPLFVSYPPGYFGMTPLDRMGVASLRISDFDPRRLSAVSTATASSGFVVEGGISAHILSGADLDAFIAEHRWNPDKFLGLTPAAALSVPQVLRRKVPASFSARLPEPDTSQALRPCTTDRLRPQGAIIRTLYPPCRRCAAADQLCVLDFPPSDPLPSRPPRCCHPCQQCHASCDMVAGLSAAFEARDEDWLSLFRVEFWEHLGDGIFQPLLPDPRSTDLRFWRESIPSGNSYPGSGWCKGSPGPSSADLVNPCQRTEKKALLVLNVRVEIPGPPGKPSSRRAGTRVPGWSSKGVVARSVPGYPFPLGFRFLAPVPAFPIVAPFPWRRSWYGRAAPGVPGSVVGVLENLFGFSHPVENTGDSVSVPPHFFGLNADPVLGPCSCWSLHNCLVGSDVCVE
ncbi:hypothetical protein K438DRAFT_1983520 [Mycena galopus ATCC 62051]|nr:hypothetical protein K438DRAFT_1983520 [Mycena galopus ATCC 62051]